MEYNPVRWFREVATDEKLMEIWGDWQRPRNNAEPESETVQPDSIDAIGLLRQENERLKGEAAKAHWLKEQAEGKLAVIEAEHGQELRGMRSFSMDLEARLEEAEKAARQEANRANNAALRAERNALRVKAIERAVPNPIVLRSMADELRQYAERIEESI